MLPNDFNWVIIKRIRSEKRVQTNVVGVKLIDIVDMEISVRHAASQLQVKTRLIGEL